MLLDVVRDGLLAGHDLVKPATDYTPDHALTLWALVLPFRLQTSAKSRCSSVSPSLWAELGPTWATPGPKLSVVIRCRVRAICPVWRLMGWELSRRRRAVMNEVVGHPPLLLRRARRPGSPVWRPGPEPTERSCAPIFLPPQDPPHAGEDWEPEGSVRSVPERAGHGYMSSSRSGLHERRDRHGVQRVSAGHDVPGPGRPDHRRVDAGVAAAGAGGARIAQRVVHRSGRHRVRAARLLRQPDRHAASGRARGRRAALQPHAHHGAVFAVAVVHDHRPQPPLQRDGGDHRAGHRLPGLQRQHPVRERVPVRDAAAARLQHLHDRQVASDAVRAGVRRRALRPVAAGARLRPLLRVPGRRHQPVVSRAGLRQPPGRAAAQPGGGLSPDRGPGRSRHLVHRRRQAGGPGQAVLPAFLHRRDARPAPCGEGVGRPVRGALRRGLGRLPPGGVRPPEGAGGHSGRRRAVAARPRRARVGDRSRPTRAASPPG